MKILEKLNNLHQYMSFNIASFIGYIILFLLICAFYPKPTGFAEYFAFIAGPLCVFIIGLVIVIYFLEQIFYYKIKNDFFIKNKILKTIRYIGAIITIIFCCFILSALI